MMHSGKFIVLIQPFIVEPTTDNEEEEELIVQGHLIVYFLQC